MDKCNYYKSLYKDIINDDYKGNSKVINDNIELLKILFLKCSRSIISEKNFSISYIKKCIDFVTYLQDDERKIINDGFLSFFNVFNNDSFNIIKFLLRKDGNYNYYIFKIIGNSTYYGNIDLKTNYEFLSNLNQALLWYKSNKDNNDDYTNNIVALLFSYSFENNYYGYLYNYIDNPNYYYDKIINSGIFDIYELRVLIYYSFDYIRSYNYLIKTFNDNIQFLFSKEKRIIR